MQELRVEELIDQAISAYDLRLERLEAWKEENYLAKVSLAKEYNSSQKEEDNGQDN